MKSKWAIPVLASILILGFFLYDSPFAMGDGIVDQSLTTGLTVGVVLGGGNIASQVFTPTVDRIDAVDVYIGSTLPSGTVTVSISAGDRTSPIVLPILGSATQVVTFPTPFAHFDFSSPIALIPGNTYLIQVTSPTAFGWVINQVGDPYPGGKARNCNGTTTSFVPLVPLGCVPLVGDLGFTTFFLDAVVGGTSIPIDTTSLLLAGATLNVWMIPVVLSAAGFGILIARKI